MWCLCLLKPTIHQPPTSYFPCCFSQNLSFKPRCLFISQFIWWNKKIKPTSQWALRRGFFADLVWDPKDGLSQSLSRAKIAKWPEPKNDVSGGVKKKNTTWIGRRSPPLFLKYGSIKQEIWCCFVVEGDVEKVFDIALSRAWPSMISGGAFDIKFLIASNPKSITPSLTPIHAFGPCWMPPLQRLRWAAKLTISKAKDGPLESLDSGSEKTPEN